MLKCRGRIALLEVRPRALTLVTRISAYRRGWRPPGVLTHVQPNAPLVLAAVTKLVAVSVPRLECLNVDRATFTGATVRSVASRTARSGRRSSSWAAATIPRVRLLLG